MSKRKAIQQSGTNPKMAAGNGPKVQLKFHIFVGQKPRLQFDRKRLPSVKPNFNALAGQGFQTRQVWRFSVAKGRHIARGESQEGAERVALERQLGRTQAGVVGLRGESSQEDQKRDDEAGQHNSRI